MVRGAGVRPFSRSTVFLGFSPFIFLSSIIIWARFWKAVSMFSIRLSVSYRIASGCVIVFGDGMLFLERWGYVGIVLLEEGLGLFFPFYGIVFPAAGDATGGSGSALPVGGGDASGVGSYVWFNLQKIWPMCCRCPLLPIVVELTVPLLRSPCSWSLLLVGTVVLVSRSGILPWS